MDPSSNKVRPSRAAKPRKKGTVLSVSEMADLLGVNRGTLSRWLEVEDCPYISRPDVPGGPWEISAPAVIEWYAARRERQAVEKVAGKAADRTLDQELDPTMIDIDEAKRRKAVADAMIREIDLDRTAGSVVPISDIAEIVTRE
ncbi:MAG TPA: terminase small subunit, partial [Amaricoccus sp.]